MSDRSAARRSLGLPPFRICDHMHDVNGWSGLMSHPISKNFRTIGTETSPRPAAPGSLIKSHMMMRGSFAYFVISSAVIS